VKKIDLKSAVASKTAPIAAQLTLQELVESYCSITHTPDPYSLRKWVEAFGDQSAWSIDTYELDIAGEAMIEAGYSPSTVNRNFSLLGQVYRWAKKSRITPKGFVSPTLHLTRYEEPIREVKLSDAELDRILCACRIVADRRFEVLVRLLAESGARLSEVVKRSWDDIDLDRREIIVERTKNKVSRVLHFSEQTAQLMKRVWSRREGMLFESVRSAGKATNYRKSWEKVRLSVGLPNLRMHDLRHHRAKQLLACGTTIGVASQVLGHSSLILQRRYGHLETHTTKQAIEQSW